MNNEELATRRADIATKGGYKSPKSQAPWRETWRGIVRRLSNGKVLNTAVKHQKIHATFGVPRDNH